MTKAKINNEFVLLRHMVRRARFCIVNKLVREAKLLRKKHGTEVQQEKYKRKADKLIAEIQALKAIKDDDISKFGILNERQITNILQDQSLSYGDRIVARIAHFKSLHDTLIQLREKFPEYKKYLREEKEKNKKSKNKATAKDNKSLKKSNLHTSNERSKKRKVINSDKDVLNSPNDSKDEEIGENTSEEKCNSRKRGRSLSEDNANGEELARIKKDNASENILIKTQPSAIKPCSVMKEAMVKRFKELLEENNLSIGDARESTDTVCDTTSRAKLADDFFITEDNRGDRRENPIAVSPAHTRSRKRNTETNTFESDNPVKIQSIKYKRDANFNKNRKYDQSRNKPRRENIKPSAKYPSKQLFTEQEKRAPARMDKNNKNKLNDANNKDENASLHPSWLAKKKQQEIMSRGFQGKKITFTDD